ncbi:MAG: hypothetical protein JSR26_05740 [Proteobacteria bacterium]|nr:hypothetical protein [Pseudomonadota bacterium]
MPRTLIAIALNAALCALTACAQGGSSPASAAASPAQPVTNSAPAASISAPASSSKNAAPTPCETDLAASDVAQILTGSQILNRYSMNAALAEPGNGCELGDANAMIDFSIRVKPPMAGGDNKQAYQSMNQYRNPKGSPLPGVGDQALWYDVHDSNIPDMLEFDTVAIKGEVICMADLHFKNGPVGDKAITAARGEELAKKLGALCNKSFSRH